MVRLIIYIVIGLLVLSFFGISLQHLIENPTTQANFAFFVDLLKQGWESLISWITNLVSPIIDTITSIFA